MSKSNTARNTGLMLFVLYACSFLASFTENLMNMALVDIMAEFSVDSVTVQWLVTGFLIVTVIVTACVAFLYRRFKLRALFFAAIACAIGGAALGYFSTSFPMLMGARIVQAVSLIFLPLMMNTVLTVIPKNKLGTFLAIGSCMISFGPAFAPVVCGSVVTVFGWRSIFLIPLIGMCILAVLGALSVRNFENAEAQLDVPSVAVLTVFLVALVYGLSQITIQPVSGGLALALMLVMGVLFVVRQNRIANPLIDLTPMKRRSFWPSALLVAITMLTIFSLSVLLPMYFETALGMTALAAGFVMLIPVVVNSAVTLLSGRIMDKKGPWPLLPVGFGLMTAGTITMSVVSPMQQVGPMFVGALIAFCGIGLVFSSSQTTGLRTLPPQENPFGVALNTTLIQMAACIGPSTFVGIMSSTQTAALAGGLAAGAAAAKGFSMAMLSATFFTAAGLVTAVIYAHYIVKNFPQGAQLAGGAEAEDKAEQS